MLSKLLDGLDTFVEYLVALIFASIVVVGGYQVFTRFFLNYSPSWTPEFQIFGHIYIIFLAIPIGYRRGAHIYMDVLRNRFPKLVGRAWDWVVELLWAGFAVALVVLGLRVARVAAMQTAPGLDVPMSYPYFGLVIGGGYLLIVVVRRAFETALGRHAGEA